MPTEKSLECIIEDKLTDILNRTDASLCSEMEKTKIDFVRRGLLTSGVYLSAVLELLSRIIFESCKEYIDDIKSIQTELNIYYSSEELDFIKDIGTNRFGHFVDLAFAGHFYNEAVRISGIYETNLTAEAVHSNLKSKINSFIQGTVDDIYSKSLIKKESMELKEQKKANKIALYALAVAIIAVLTTIVSMFVNG